MLTRHDVGHRVTIRRTLDRFEGRQRFADLIGELVEYTEEDLAIRTNRGMVRVPHHAVNAARRMPDRRPLSATGRLELIAAAGWPAPDLSYLGDWLLRAAAGWSARGNSALPVGQPGLDLPEAVDAVTEWYTTRDLQPAIMVPEPIGGRLTTELRARNWVGDPSVLFRTATVERVVAAAARANPEAGAGARPGKVVLDPAPSPDWLAAVASRPRGLPDAALKIITGVPRARYASIRDTDGTILATGRGVIAEDGTWLGISMLHTEPRARRLGLGTAVVGALAGWAASQRAGRVYLQVEEHNSGAVALYDRLGFETHHRYTTWRPAPAGS